MLKILRAYAFSVAQILGVVLIAVCSLWFGSWYEQGESEYIAIFNLNQSDVSKHVATASFWDVTTNNLFSLNTPVPYMTVSLLIGLVGGFGGIRNQYKIGKYDELEAKHRIEKSSHGDTQRNYYEAIDYIIHSIFVSTDDDFDSNCRITIYRHTNDEHLQQIYRHAAQTRFNDGGRLRLSDAEGVVGAAWRNDGIAHISLNSNFGTQSYNQQLARELALHGAEPPSSVTRMPTRDYFAMAIRGVGRTKMAVIVLESTVADTWVRAKLEYKIAQEDVEIAKYIVHKGKLDEILNPDGELENG